MKKCGLLILSLMIITFCSCNNSGNEHSKGTLSDSNANVVATGEQNDTALYVNETIPLDSYVHNSPTMKLKLMLAGITLNNNAATEKAVNEISYALTGSDGKSIAEAGNKYISRVKAEFLELRPEYINVRESVENPHWFNYEYDINSSTDTGYKGYVNYTIDFFEFTGGAHPNSYKIILTFDPTDGHEVTLSEIMKEGYEEPLLAIITDELLKFFKVESVEELEKMTFGLDNLFISKNVIMNNNKMTFVYNKYDIAPYAVGEIVIDIEQEKLKDLIK